ncbi:MAG: hypothetical protein U0R80_13080 [Nocardioidaceae bacterium]
MPGLGRAIRAELLKFFTTRLWWGMAIGVFLCAAALSVVFAILYTLDAVTSPENGAAIPITPTQLANTVYTAGLSLSYLLLLTIGVIQVGAEYRHKTITGTFLATPHRARVMVAKVVSLLLIGGAYGVLSLVGSVVFGAVALQIRGEDPFPSVQILRTLALSLLVLGLWALIGLGVGILIPNQIASLLIGVGVAWIGLPIITFAMSFWDFGREHLVPFFPNQATSAVIDIVQSSANEVRLDWWGGAIVLALWAAIPAGVGILRTVRQDVS